MAYFVADEKLQGYYVSGGVTINIVKYHFECDNAASLPAQTAFISSKNIKISMASTAHTIDTDALYKMDSSGAWVQQSQPWKPLADYSVLTNKPQINGHTMTGNQSGADLGLQNTLTFDITPTQSSTNPVTSGGIWTDQQRQDVLQIEDRAALVELVDNGAKNLIPVNSATSTPQTTTMASNVPFTSNGGEYVISYDSANTTGTVVFGFRDSNDELVRSIYIGNAFKITTTTIPTNVSYFNIYTTSYGDYTNIMICTAAAYAISPAFVPYRPSWQEMYDMILALQ